MTHKVDHLEAILECNIPLVAIDRIKKILPVIKDEYGIESLHAVKVSLMYAYALI